MPTLFVIAGCNGAVKTTLSKNLLPEYLGVKEFVNADEIARGLSPFNPEGVAFTAGRIMLERIQELAKEKKDFAIETTLATKTYESLFKELQSDGYDIILLFFFLNSFEMAKERVRKRVEQGGHSIPLEVIERRYSRGIQNLVNSYISIADEWKVYDNSNNEPVLVAEGLRSEMSIFEPEIWKQIKSHE